PATPSPCPLRDAHGRIVARRDPLDPRAAALLPPDSRPPEAVSGQAHRRLARGLPARSPGVSRQPPPAHDGRRLPGVSAIALSPVVGGLRQTALWQSRPRAA